MFFLDSTLSSNETRRLVETGILGNSTANMVGDAQRVKAERALAAGMDRGNRAQVEEGFKEGREYYLKLAAKPELLPPDSRGAQDIINANAKGLTSKESANLFDQFLQKNGASAPENYRSMVGQLSEEIQRLENLKTQDVQWKNYQIWRAKELRQELLERYYTAKYRDKYNDIDVDRMGEREIRLYREHGEDLEKVRAKAKKNMWPGS